MTVRNGSGGIIKCFGQKLRVLKRVKLLIYNQKIAVCDAETAKSALLVNLAGRARAPTAYVYAYPLPLYIYYILYYKKKYKIITFFL